MEKVKQRAPAAMPNAEALPSDQFVERVLSSSLCGELKQLVRGKPNFTLLDVRAEAIQWEREGLPGGMRGRSRSVPSVFGVRYGVQGGPQASFPLCSVSEISKMKEMLKRQHEQLNQLTEGAAWLQNSQHSCPPRTGSLGGATTVRGTAYIPFVNVGSTDVWLRPRTAVGMLDFVNVVSLPCRSH